MSFWTKLFGANEIIELTKDGIDAAIFTNEERAKHYIEVLKFIEPFKIAQRWIAAIIVGTYAFVWVMAAFIYVSAVFTDPGAKSDQLMAIARQLADQNNENLGIPTAIILAFYFAGGAFEGIIARIKK